MSNNRKSRKSEKQRKRKREKKAKHEKKDRHEKKAKHKKKARHEEKSATNTVVQRELTPYDELVKAVPPVGMAAIQKENDDAHRGQDRALTANAERTTVESKYETLGKIVDMMSKGLCSFGVNGDNRDIGDLNPTKAVEMFFDRIRLPDDLKSKLFPIRLLETHQRADDGSVVYNVGDGQHRLIAYTAICMGSLPTNLAPDGSIARMFSPNFGGPGMSQEEKISFECMQESQPFAQGFGTYVNSVLQRVSGTNELSITERNQKNLIDVIVAKNLFRSDDTAAISPHRVHGYLNKPVWVEYIRGREEDLPQRVSRTLAISESEQVPPSPTDTLQRKVQTTCKHVQSLRPLLQARTILTDLRLFGTSGLLLPSLLNAVLYLSSADEQHEVILKNHQSLHNEKGLDKFLCSVTTNCRVLSSIDRVGAVWERVIRAVEEHANHLRKALKHDTPGNTRAPIIYTALVILAANGTVELDHIQSMLCEADLKSLASAVSKTRTKGRGFKHFFEAEQVKAVLSKLPHPRGASPPPNAPAPTPSADSQEGAAEDENDGTSAPSAANNEDNADAMQTTPDAEEPANTPLSPADAPSEPMTTTQSQANASGNVAEASDSGTANDEDLPETAQPEGAAAEPDSTPNTPAVEPSSGIGGFEGSSSENLPSCTNMNQEGSGSDSDSDSDSSSSEEEILDELK